MKMNLAIAAILVGMGLLSLLIAFALGISAEKGVTVLLLIIIVVWAVLLIRRGPTKP